MNKPSTREPEGEDHIFKMSAAEQLRRIKKRELGIEELVRMYLERIETYDQGPDGLSSVCELNPRVLEEARKMDSQKDRRAPLFGLPILIKDNIDVEGLHSTSGSLALADNLVQKDADVTANLKRNGALVLGKTNMTEFANYMAEYMPGGYSSRGGQVMHAYDREKNPGGSSSGSAVAVSAGLCSAAIGTDTSFSIVGCATLNGIAGLKPAHGSLSLRGIIPISHTLDMAGPMTRDLTDALLIYSAMRDTPFENVEPKNVKELRIGVNPFHTKRVPDERIAMTDELISTLRGEGVHVEVVHHPHKIAEDEIMHYEFRNALEAYLSSSNAKRKTLAEILAFYEEDPEGRMQHGYKYLREALEEASGDMDEPEYVQALKKRKEYKREVYQQLETFDAALMGGHTGIMHFIGAPSVALPIGLANDGTPAGIILYGKDERELFSAALTVETYTKHTPFPKQYE